MSDGNISPWLPEQDRLRLAVFGKLIEECNELSARAARCIIQGIGQIDPDTHRSNFDELAQEMADVDACLDVAREHFALPQLQRRQLRKRMGFRRWHDLIRGTVE